MAAVFILSAELVGILSGFFANGNMSSWYEHLTRPVFTPPGWIFGPVWVILYAVMGFAAYLVWKSKRRTPAWHVAMRLYWLQLIFNFLWSIIFFGQMNIGLALVDICVLLALIVATMIAFLKINTTAGWLMTPYVLWVVFALVLNSAFFVLNKTPGRPSVTPPKNDIVNSLVFFCSDNKTVRAVFHTTNKVDLTLSDGRLMTLPQTVSADGARYANANDVMVFWEKGRTAFVQEKGVTTYVDCATK